MAGRVENRAESYTNHGGETVCMPKSRMDIDSGQKKPSGKRSMGRAGRRLIKNDACCNIAESKPGVDPSIIDMREPQE
jgi:hypothetical protein